MGSLIDTFGSQPLDFFGALRCALTPPAASAPASPPPCSVWAGRVGCELLLVVFEVGSSKHLLCRPHMLAIGCDVQCSL